MRRREQESGMPDEVIAIRFHTKVTKGGRNLSCAALMAVGDGHGKVGLGYGKAKAVPMAIEKASKEARANMVKAIMVGDTIGHEIIGRHKAARVLLRPAPPGTGVKAGRTVRAIMKVLGVHNVVSKVHGNTNPVNVARATMNALEEMRTVEEVRRLRGCQVTLFHPQVRKAEPEPVAVSTEAAPTEERAPEAPETAEPTEQSEQDEQKSESTSE